MSDSKSLARVERFTSGAVGGMLLLVAVSLWAWAVRLVVAAGQADAPWPPGFFSLLLPVAGAAVLVGFGAWRILRMALPTGLGGALTLGRLVLLAFAAASVAGAAI